MQLIKALDTRAVIDTRLQQRTDTALCFSGRRGTTGFPHPSVDPPTASLRDIDILPEGPGAALATVLQFLLCGEESATHVFTRSQTLDPTQNEVLQSIADDEIKHAQWISAWSSRLPQPLAQFDLQVTRSFFRRLLTRHRAVHYARIAALDAGVCRILNRILRGDTLMAYRGLRDGLAQIRDDEVEHVRITRSLAFDAGITGDQWRAIRTDIEVRMCKLLRPARTSIDILTQRRERQTAHADR